MSTPQALGAQNTLLQYQNGASPAAFVTLANVSSIKGPMSSVKMDDVTSHSTGIPWRQWQPTLLDGGDVTFDMFFIPADAGHQTFQEIYVNRGVAGASGTPVNWKIIFPDTAATTWEFQGFVSKMDFTMAVDGVVKSACAIRITGKPSFAGV
jgi:Lambda phage tail tube protein, TTP